jgi:hypothetical protein
MEWVSVGDYHGHGRAHPGPLDSRRDVAF